MPVDTLKIIFIDDDEITGSVLKRQCNSVGYRCVVYNKASDGLKGFVDDGADLIITDLRMPEMNGFELLKKVRKINQNIPVLVMTGYSSVDTAVEAMKCGATDFIKKPFDFSELKLLLDRTMETIKLRNENIFLRSYITDAADTFGMIGNSPAMEKLYKTIDKVASVDCNVIITGESGTGKELVARALHANSPRSKIGPFVVIDCGALPESLLESELFGHEKGAFTGATQRKKGLMEQASGGTLFLDELCNIPDSMQMKLMRAIEAQKIIRVGGVEEIPIDLRIVSASNRDLLKMVEGGQFRHDFYHRLNVVNIRVPALSERRDDIPKLVDHFITEFTSRYNRRVKGFTAESVRKISAAQWPGNIRQLKNTVERCVILAEDEWLVWDESGNDGAADSEQLQFQQGGDFITLDELEKRYIQHVLTHYEGKRIRVAEVLGIDKTTLWRKLQKYEQETV